MPSVPVDAITRPLNRFLHIEAASGAVLILFTIAALILANSPIAGDFHHLLETPIGISIGSFALNYSLHHWINDGLMTIFFFVVGLEIKREFVFGELRDPKKAALPLAAAIGGMVAPAGIYLLLQGSGPAARGWGIPMATDIAFVVGCMAVLGPRIPHGLRIMLLSLAIVDDIGAIIVIAIGYTEGLDLRSLFIGCAGFLVCVFFNRIGIRSVAVYIVVGIAIWYSFMMSGIHATVSGVVLGLITPGRPWIDDGLFGDAVRKTAGLIRGNDSSGSTQRHDMLRQMAGAARETIPPLERLESLLHPWVSFAIMPVFAFANAGVHLDSSGFSNPIGLAVIAGLLLGKPIGIFLTSFVAVRLGVARLPSGLGWSGVIGGGFLGGIGFTMALFIAGLALDGDMLDASKIGILVGSLASAIVGSAILIVVLPKPTDHAR